MNSLSVSTTNEEQYIGWFYLVFQMLILPDLIILTTRLMGLTLSLATLNVVYFAINFLSVIAIFHSFLWETAKRTYKEPLRLLKSVGIGLVLYWFFNYYVAIFIMLVSPQYQNINNANINTMAQEQFLPIAVSTILLAPFAEELLFRGLIFQNLHRRNRLLAYGISSAAFCIIHLMGYLGQISPVHFFIGFVQYLPAGIAFCYAYEKADSIFAPILMHMLINTIGIFATR